MGEMFEGGCGEGKGSGGGSGVSISRARSVRPIPTTHAPKITTNKFRKAIGSPEKGASIVKTPRRISVLMRDIGRSVSHDWNQSQQFMCVTMS